MGVEGTIRGQMGKLLSAFGLGGFLWVLSDVAMTMQFQLKPDGGIAIFAKAGFSVIDSGFPAVDNATFWWVDNDRVIFKGYEVGTYDPESAQHLSETEFEKGREKGMKVGYYIWDIKKHSFTLYRRDILDFCYEDGEAFFVGKVVGRLTVAKGPLWKEKEIPGAKPSDFPDYRTLIRYPCGMKRSRPLGETFPLKSGWGQLETGWFPDAAKLEWPVRYTPTKGNPVDLPILRKKWGSVVHAPWRDQYLLTESYNNTSIMPELWWLSKDGRTEAIAIPNTGYVSAMFFPVRPGVLMVGRWRPGEKYGLGAQSYLVGSNGSVGDMGRLGFQPYSISISPDGCRMAAIGARCIGTQFNRSADRAAPNDIGCWTAHIIDFCQKGETK